MKNINKELSIYIQCAAFVGIWVFILYISNSELKIDMEAIKKLPDVVFIYAILHLLFIKWLWKIPLLQGWLVPFPNLNGTWRGTLKSTWINPETQRPIEPISVIIVIKQTFSSIGCIMFTEESESYSTSAQINEDDDSNIFRLSYSYTNRSHATIRDRSQIHDGATILKIVAEPEKCLEGEYWTSRKTTGEISVRFVSRKHAQKFTLETT